MKTDTSKITWNLGLLYKNPRDPQIEQDMQEIEKACEKFAKKWDTKKLDLNNITTLTKIMDEYEQVLHILESAKPLFYVSKAQSIDRGNTYLQSLSVQLESRYTVASNKIIFMELAMGNIKPESQIKVLKNPKCQKYAYFLKHIWRESKHRLSKDVEQVIALKRIPAYSAWVNGTEKLLSELSVKFNGVELPINSAIGMIGTLPDAKRQKLLKLVQEQIKSISYFAESELNAVILNKKIDDELRGFKYPYSATIMEYENDEQVIMNLMNLVNQYQHVAHRFFRIKANLMDKQKLTYADLNVNLSIKKQVYTWEDAINITKKSFEKVDPQYREIFEKYLKNGQIDVYPRTGKTGGGFCSSGHNVPTYILLNWADELRSLTTLVHEMGHGVHAELSKSQNVFHEDHPISIAEVASTLFENFVFEEIISGLSFEEQVYARFNKLQEAMGAVFRQGAYINYELEIHKQIRRRGVLQSDDFARIMQHELQNHLGRVFDITRDDGYLWVRYMHSRWFFYSYSYAYGHLISTILYKKYKEDNSFIKQINQFLSAGGSDTPENIFKSIGIDTSKSSFWESGLQAIEQEVIELEKMVKKLNK